VTPGADTPPANAIPPGSLPPGIEAVIFDLDGTLVDTQAVWRRAFAEVLDVACERYPQLGEMGSPQYLHDDVFQPIALTRQAELGGEWDDALLLEAFRRFLAQYAEQDEPLAFQMDALYSQKRVVDLFPETRSTLDALTERFQLAMITNGPGENQRSRLAPLSLDGYFESIVVSGEFGIRKPDPAIFNHVLEAIDVPASSAVYIGDSYTADVGGAKGAGLSAVWLNREGSAMPSDGAQPDATIATLDELLLLLGVG
jgi:putative hydrolase of the HAD superfamily